MVVYHPYPEVTPPTSQMYLCRVEHKRGEVTYKTCWFSAVHGFNRFTLLEGRVTHWTNIPTLEGDASQVATTNTKEMGLT